MNGLVKKPNCRVDPALIPILLYHAGGLKEHKVAPSPAAVELVEMRERWLNADLTPNPSALTGMLRDPKGRGEQRTLTNLYNQHPTWLELAYKKLDEAVFAAYGWPNDLLDEEILEKLLALNLDRAK